MSVKCCRASEAVIGKSGVSESALRRELLTPLRELAATSPLSELDGYCGFALAFCTEIATFLTASSYACCLSFEVEVCLLTSGDGSSSSELSVSAGVGFPSSNLATLGAASRWLSLPVTLLYALYTASFTAESGLALILDILLFRSITVPSAFLVVAGLGGIPVL